MGIRTGDEVLEGLRDGREVWLDGERIADVTADRRLAGGARTLAELYDLQHDPDLTGLMTCPSPGSGGPVGRSFCQPASHDELVARRRMMKVWADHTCGMFSRSPDFLNVMIAAFAGAADAVWRDGAYGGNMRRFYEEVRDGDVVMTHSLTNPAVDRSKDVSEQDKDVAARIVRETDAGIVVRGARMLATLGAFSDEMLVMPAPSFPLPDTEAAKAYAFGFSVPVATPGLRLICRPALAPGDAGSPLDHPLALRFEETDCMAVFDDVLVPWERVFIHRDIEVFNNIYRISGAGAHMAHQYVTKDLAKAEFMMALGFTMVRTTNIDGYQHVEGMLAELINMAEMVRSCLIASEVEAAASPFGTMAPSYGPLQAVRFTFPDMFTRMGEIIRRLGAGGLFMLPSFAEFEGGVAADVERYYQAANADSRSRVKLFRLAFDAALSSFAGRQQLYERYFAADPVRAAGNLYRQYDKAPHVERIWRLLEEWEGRRNPEAGGPPFLSRGG